MDHFATQLRSHRGMIDDGFVGVASQHAATDQPHPLTPRMMAVQAPENGGLAIADDGMFKIE